MFDETTIFYVKLWNHPTETTIKKWMFRVPGRAIGNHVQNKFWVLPAMFYVCLVMTKFHLGEGTKRLQTCAGSMWRS